MIRFLYPNGKKRAITFSYDDGQIFDRKLIELLNKYGLRGTFHLNSGTIGTQGFVNQEELVELYQGHEISVHGYHHPFLNQLCKSELVYEIMEDRKQLEAYTNTIIRGMSYPYGVYTEEIKETARNLGIEYARTTNQTGSFQIPEDFMEWNPTCHHNQLKDELLDQFFNTPEHRKLYILYIWGHSFEFDKKNNWEFMETMCEKLACKKDVWYATNIEIKDYCSAMKNMKVSVDGKKIYNPTATDIWLLIDNLEIQLKSGEWYGI